MNACQSSINDFLKRNISAWKGLQADCKKNKLETMYAFNNGEGMHYSGLLKVQYRYRTLTQKNFESEIFFNFYNDALSFITTPYFSFLQQECNKIFTQLGEPKSKLDFYWGSEILNNAEWVYAERGITLCVIPNTMLIAKLLAYPVCDIYTYKNNYYSVSKEREFKK